jgi:hypothetical protein
MSYIVNLAMSVGPNTTLTVSSPGTPAVSVYPGCSPRRNVALTLTMLESAEAAIQVSWSPNPESGSAHDQGDVNVLVSATGMPASAVMPSSSLFTMAATGALAARVNLLEDGHLLVGPLPGCGDIYAVPSPPYVDSHGHLRVNSGTGVAIRLPWQPVIDGPV